MATYAIGDVQGCFLTLQKLLARIRFDRRRDRLWLVGDLVNRGPRSLEVLRWARSEGPRVTAVLGNHDVHLLGVASGLRTLRSQDTLAPVLEAPDARELILWLKRRPLFFRKGSTVLVHAGLLPRWSVAKAERLAREVEKALRGRRAHLVLARTPSPLEWRDDLKGRERFRCIGNVFTRLRTCTPEGRMCLDFSGPPEEAPRGCRPWFEIPRASARCTIIFGHWAALGFQRRRGVIALDSGCVWGGRLTAVRLSDGRAFSVPFSD